MSVSRTASTVPVSQITKFGAAGIDLGGRSGEPCPQWSVARTPKLMTVICALRVAPAQGPPRASEDRHWPGPPAAAARGRAAADDGDDDRLRVVQALGQARAAEARPRSARAARHSRGREQHLCRRARCRSPDKATNARVDSRRRAWRIWLLLRRCRRNRGGGMARTPARRLEPLEQRRRADHDRNAREVHGALGADPAIEFRENEVPEHRQQDAETKDVERMLGRRRRPPGSRANRERRCRA